MAKHFLPTSATIGLFACFALFATTADAAKKKPADPAGPDFDRTAAVSAIAGVDLQKCKATNAPHGDGHVSITFASNGEASNVAIDKGPWSGPIAKCMTKQFKTAKVPAFQRRRGHGR